ncbi:MAG: molybdopterin-dependent oxidoreductase [Gemmatimonadetes bacterium]|nr:molybdopterin-dependent oxidoreductase [Gemmatimonadota bacterium]
MTTRRLATVKALLLCIALLAIAPASSAAQDLTVRRVDGSERRLTGTELASLPRTAFEVTDHGVATRLEGVELRAVLQLGSAGPTDTLRGPMLRRVVLLLAADGYAATIALADLDPSIGARRVYLVDRANGVPLAADQGPWRAVVVGDVRATRWVRQLQRLELVDLH